MGKSLAVIHRNPALNHQIKLAEQFAAGFKRSGQAWVITSDQGKAGDIHVVLGPHYALNQWRNHHRCVWVDRAFWGDPECVSVGGSAGIDRKFPAGAGWRNHPELVPWTDGRDCIVLADYGDTGLDLAALVRPHCERVEIRRHPAEGGSGALSDALQGFQIAIGRNTSALVEAAISGLSVVCKSPRSPVMPIASASIRDLVQPDRNEWLRGLSWANWSGSEIESGELWECLTTA